VRTMPSQTYWMPAFAGMTWYNVVTKRKS
jgi:hypothetical protein